MKKLVTVCLGWLCAVCMGAANADSTYTELDYVEATGSQWVDTGIVGRYDTKAEIKAEWMTNQGDMTMLSCRGSADTESRVNFMNATATEADETFYVGYGYGAFVTPTWVDERSVKNVYYWERDRVYTVVTEFTKTAEDATSCTMTVDGVTASNEEKGVVVLTDYNLTIFANNIAGTISGHARARCYGLKIWQKPVGGGDYVLVRDFVPVLKEDRAGFLDTVSGSFFFSDSGTDLVAGTFANVPDGFAEYVESDGSAYVDLGVVGQSGVTMESRMVWTEVPGDGSYVASRQGANARFYLYHHYQNDTIGYGGYYQSGVVAQPGVVQDIRAVLKSGEQSLVVNGASRFGRTDSATVNTGLNLFLFACNKDGDAQYKTKARCYSLKLWEGDTLVRDFRPCLKNQKAALYDQVSETIFYAKGGRLRAFRPPTAGRPDYFVEYIASKGDNYFDTGVRARNDTRAAGDFQLTNAKRTVDMDRDGYFGSAVYHEERTVLGACAKSDGNGRYYFSHMPNAQYWVGYDNLRFYPETYEDGKGSRIELGTSRHTFDVTLEDGRQAVIVDGREICVSNATGSVDAGGNLYLLACNKAGSANYMVNARLYELKIWQKPTAGGDYVALRDYRPCVKDGVAGLYDAVNDQVVYPVNVIPDDCIGKPVYTADMKPVEVLEYVDTDGSQWIDTGVTGRVDTVAEFKMEWLDSRWGLDVGFLGSRQTSGDTRFYMWHTANGYQSFGYGAFSYLNAQDASDPKPPSASKDTAIWADSNQVFQVRASFLADQQTIVVDGVTRVSVARDLNLDTGYPMYLFAYNNYGSAACKCAARLYSLKLWQDGKLVRHFLPVRLNCGLNALYDKVEQKIYEPQGGEFTAWGPSIGAYKSNLNTMIIIR